MSKHGTTLDDWAKLHVDYHRDAVLRAASSIEPVCMSVWPLLVAMSKGQSHATTNPTGIISTSLGDLAGALYVPVEGVHRALDKLVEGEFITYEIGRLQTLRITVLNFNRWQSPRKSKAQRDERNHANTQAARAGVLPLMTDAPSTPDRRMLDDRSTIDGDGDGDKTRQEEKKADAPKKKRRKKRPDSRMLVRVDDAELDARITSCFEWYCDLFGKKGALSLLLTQDRYDAIEWALEKHGREKVAEVLRGYRSDPWRMESLDRNDIATLLRSEKQIELGTDKAAKAAGLSASGIDLSAWGATGGAA